MKSDLDFQYTGLLLNPEDILGSHLFADSLYDKKTPALIPSLPPLLQV